MRRAADRNSETHVLLLAPGIRFALGKWSRKPQHVFDGSAKSHPTLVIVFAPIVKFFGSIHISHTSAASRGHSTQKYGVSLDANAEERQEAGGYYLTFGEQDATIQAWAYRPFRIDDKCFVFPPFLPPLSVLFLCDNQY